MEWSAVVHLGRNDIVGDTVEVDACSAHFSGNRKIYCLCSDRIGHCCAVPLRPGCGKRNSIKLFNVIFDLSQIFIQIYLKSKGSWNVWSLQDSLLQSELSELQTWEISDIVNVLDIRATSIESGLMACVANCVIILCCVLCQRDHKNRVFVIYINNFILWNFLSKYICVFVCVWWWWWWWRYKRMDILNQLTTSLHETHQSYHTKWTSELNSLLHGEPLIYW